MQNLESLHLQLPAELIASLNAAVASGEYVSASEAAYVVLSQWDMRRKIRLEELRALIKEGEESGDAPPETLEEFLAAARAYQSAKK